MRKSVLLSALTLTLVLVACTAPQPSVSSPGIVIVNGPSTITPTPVMPVPVSPAVVLTPHPLVTLVELPGHGVEIKSTNPDHPAVIAVVLPDGMSATWAGGDAGLVVPAQGLRLSYRQGVTVAVRDSHEWRVIVHWQ